MRSTLLQIVILSVLARDAHAALGNFVLFPNRDSQGGALYGGAPVQTMDESACRLVCALDTQCYGYTWVQPSNPTWAGNCYRKGTTACNPNDLAKPAPGKFSGLIANSCGEVYCGTTKVNVTPGTCTTPTPTPSGLRARLRRQAERDAQRVRQLQLCPSGSTACPLGTLSSGYECVDLLEELERCGDCNTDCTAIAGAEAVTCRGGQCIVSECQKGFQLHPNLTGGECRRSKLSRSSKRHARGHGSRSTGL